MQRLASVLIAILALAVFAAAGYVVLKKDPVPHAGRVLPVPTIASGDPSSDSTSNGSPKQVVAFLGDDWTAGTKASTKGKSFTAILTRKLDLDAHNFGVDGTGYAKTSTSGGSYTDRVDKIVALKPDAVVVSGGRNDNADALSTVSSAVKTLFSMLHKRLPRTKLIAIAPMWGDSDKPDSLNAIAGAVKRNVLAVGGMFLAIPDPIHGHPEWMSANEADPNDKGYAAVAKAVRPKLAQALTASS